MAGPDLSVFQRQKTLVDQQSLQRAFEQQKALQALQVNGQLAQIQNAQTAAQAAAAEREYQHRQNAFTNQLAQNAAMRDQQNRDRDYGLKVLELHAKQGNPLTTDPSGVTALPLDNLDPITQSQIQVESGGDPYAVSSAGAQGIMQIRPETARDPGYGVTPLQGWDGFNPKSATVAEQIRFGNEYRDALIAHNGGSITRGLAAYNAGPGAVDRAGGDISKLPVETQNYVPKVMAGMNSVRVKNVPIQTQSTSTAFALQTPNQTNTVIANGMTPKTMQKPASTAISIDGQEGQFLYDAKTKRPFIDGLEKGQQWAQDAQGNRFIAPIPGFVSVDKAKEKENAPMYLEQGQNALNLIDQLIKHPGLSTSVGLKGVTGGALPGWFPGADKDTGIINGTDAADFKSLLDQVRGGTFLEAYKNLKGSGAISNNEGVRAENAIARLQTAQSEKSFIAAAEEYKQIIQQGINRQKKLIGGSGSQTPQNTTAQSNDFSGLWK